jgi:transposase, IS5 family
VPDAKTIWLYREALAKDETAKALFEAFGTHLKEQGYLAMSGQIVDATIVPVPKNRNTPEENAAIKAGETPGGWAEKPARLRQKDLDARWTKKHGQSYYGYKNHINIDRKHKLVRKYTVTDAARHDSQELEAVLDPDNTASEIWADSAYRSAEIEEKPKEKHLRSRIHRKANRRRKLTKREAGQQDALEGAGAGGACVRPLHDLDGEQAGSHDRYGAGAHEDRAAQPDLQHDALCLP